MKIANKTMNSSNNNNDDDDDDGKQSERYKIREALSGLFGATAIKIRKKQTNKPSST